MPSPIRSCRNDRSRGPALGAAALTLLIGLAGPALAQGNRPVRLLPPPPGTAPAVPDPPAAPAPTPPADESINATPLAPVDPAWVGTLGAPQALPPTMWQGTSRSVVAAALPALGPTTSPVLQDLSRRLLLSNAAAPAGQDPPNQPGLAALRVERLAALGEVEGAIAVIDALPATLRDESMARRRIELAFAKNDGEDACRSVQTNIARYQSVWWDRALIACQALAGDREKAALGISLLHEQKAPADPTFDALVAAVGGRALKLDKLAQPTPMLVSLLAAAKATQPRDPLGEADPASLRAWATNESVPALQRLAAAERAAALGAITPEALGDLYAKASFTPEELGQAIKQGKAPANPRDRALLYQVARSDPATGVRTAALAALLDDARKRGVFIVTARALAPIVLELQPGEELASFAPEAMRALYAASRPDAAAAWLPVADPASAPTLTLLGQLANGGTLAPAFFDTAIAALAERDPHQATLVLAVFAPIIGLDVRPPVAEWGRLADKPHDGVWPSAAVWLDQRQAAAKKRLGETVLMTLLIARSGERLSLEPVVLADAVAGLAAVGLESEARALALEAALAAGI
ncbi:MAG TPA: hypothetical protein VGU20_31790 [Stellaceae bacterium]|nr:hypothetical protein [Stellaceae bacterium]